MSAFNSFFSPVLANYFYFYGFVSLFNRLLAWAPTFPTKDFESFVLTNELILFWAVLISKILPLIFWYFDSTGDLLLEVELVLKLGRFLIYAIFV